MGRCAEVPGIARQKDRLNKEKEINDRRESYILRDIIILTINSESVDDKDEYISEDNQIWN